MSAEISSDVSTPVSATQAPAHVRLCPHCGKQATDKNPVTYRVYVEGKPRRFNGGKRAACHHYECAFAVAKAAHGDKVGVFTGNEWAERQKKSSALAPQPEPDTPSVLTQALREQRFAKKDTPVPAETPVVEEQSLSVAPVDTNQARRERKEAEEEQKRMLKLKQSKRKDKRRGKKSISSKSRRRKSGESPEDKLARELAVREEAAIVDLFRYRLGRSWDDDVQAFATLGMFRGGLLTLADLSGKPVLSQGEAVVLDGRGEHELADEDDIVRFRSVRPPRRRSHQMAHAA